MVLKTSNIKILIHCYRFSLHITLNLYARVLALGVRKHYLGQILNQPFKEETQQIQDPIKKEFKTTEEEII